MRAYTIFLISAALLASGCSSNPKERPERSEAQQYEEVRKQIERNNFLTAIDELRELEARFPYGDYAEQAQLDLIYTQYRALDYPATVASATRFLRNYPANEHLDYVLYMKGLANYNLERGLFDRIMHTDKASRDMDAWRDAFNDFQELVSRFPDSQYSPDARARMVFIRNQLAEHELHAARYYARRGAYVAAAARAREVVIHYQETPSVEEALAIMSRAYRSLGEAQLSDKSLAVLRHNWPDSGYINNEGRVALSWWPSEDGGLLSLLTFDLL
ncbi:outer membrane assembly lipoprotein YfiO [Isoalcanivorax pacificus W11-5]|uniref:Outer membrane protein assembly factor BamD n=1 Tax=Isoalcanivorax pacificus W11-5 TaxID=391936 RepID=A0A0B4XK65_9GAMM|nr:outer membrane protein assembly factor BamD [Isoalcanivorax pacificus]AJD47080.1 outer membrane assembly lipoprotein YfiO [Isoalcanivorax pacificus W11-5]